MAMESAASTTARARRILNGAKAKQKETWDELFQSADKDRSKMLDIKELKTVLREKLNICEAALSDFEVQTIHSEIDSDQSGVVDWQEFLQFVARGPKRPEDEAKLFALRTKRVHRNMRLAFNKFQTDQSAVQKLFEKIDKGCDRKISIHELLTFVRSDLKLTQWDVFESELKAFYKTMDTNGDGLDVDELLLFIRKTRSTFQKGKVDRFSFVEDPRPGTLRKQPTFRMQLLSERMSKVQFVACTVLYTFLRESWPHKAAHCSLIYLCRSSFELARSTPGLVGQHMEEQSFLRKYRPRPASFHVNRLEVEWPAKFAAVPARPWGLLAGMNVGS